MHNIKHMDYSFIKNIVRQVEKNLGKVHSAILKSVIFEAASYATKNLPTLDDVSIEPYLTTIRGKYLALKKSVSVQLQAGVQRFLGTVSIASLNESVNNLRAGVGQLKTKITNLETDKNRIDINTSGKAWKHKRFLLLLFGLAEALLNASGFLHLGDIVLIAVIVGLVIGLAQVYGAEMTVLNIREEVNLRKQRIYYWLAFFGFLLFSLVIGSIRYYFAHTGIAADMPFIFLNPFTFAVFNMVFVIAAALLVHYFFPSKEEIKLLEQIEDIEAEIKKADVAKAKLEAKLAEEVLKREQVVAISVMLKHDEVKLLEKVGSYFDEAVGSFKHENTTKRSDNTHPECFKFPHEPLGGDNNEEFISITTKLEEAL